MNKICTTLEESKKLIELGIDVNTADMCYINGKANIGFLSEEYKMFGDNILTDYWPAWSLSALLGVIKPINENTYTIRGTLDGGATISFDEITNVMFQEEEIIDAVFEMVVLLKEKGKI